METFYGQTVARQRFIFSFNFLASLINGNRQDLLLGKFDSGSCIVIF
jgi:hypothetical protein